MCKVMEEMREEAVERDKVERVKRLIKLEIADTMELTLDKVKEISWVCQLKCVSSFF